MPLSPCGCIPLKARTASGRRVIHCPLHAAAPKLLIALKQIVADGILNGGQEIAARSLIAEAEKSHA